MKNPALFSSKDKSKKLKLSSAAIFVLFFAADDILIYYSYLSKKIRLDFSCESLKHQVFFSLINNEKIFMNAVCCSRDWRFKG